MSDARLAVFVSGSGTNMENIARVIESGKLKGCRIQLVLSDQRDAYALKRAEQLKLKTMVIERGEFQNKLEFEAAITQVLQREKIHFIVLAGFMRVLSPEFVKTFRGRILNIHPSLLPRFKGAKAIQDAYESRESKTGVTVHFVDEGVDTGPIILQREVNILPDETLSSLEARIHAVEYELYPEAIQCLVDGRLELKGKRVRIRSLD
ncbi:MAG: phosphoribosylglycinamide formyltransferase [Candidatus Omnitrophica bacterium CG11_big_fil_rev_8_21_14_0_20_45_26]|uniref:Phosphoribosylglycinamide formyltransferase n=1 Tax=Candidatus Abzuiibacterium crystallinum TaxID=1974748 RepID=A0A2H0LMZ6_9BACT|nr:MAG: phosphoribosylglycinamide formyltransferase [Candidatus Omnitrophica bacterium CG11_big_fil_rev_8_21_14_0_20_45_26]PIW65494.1 MAG: phosphoribosylglycinamide formyltransferase [Candidatus Omnitrophica bacterium CG12_big_fil_rev_8_21_14_0_65_45_16]